MTSPRLIRLARIFVLRSRTAQVMVLVMAWLGGTWGSRLLGLPFPGAVVGLLAVLLMLGLGWVRPTALRRGARFLMGEMLLFFVPAVLAVMEHSEWLSLYGLKIVLAVVVGTLAVMVGTALSVGLTYRWWVHHGVR